MSSFSCTVDSSCPRGFFLPSSRCFTEYSAFQPRPVLVLGTEVQLPGLLKMGEDLGTCLCCGYQTGAALAQYRMEQRSGQSPGHVLPYLGGSWDGFGSWWLCTVGLTCWVHTQLLEQNNTLPPPLF